ncbi:targeting protein for Xklp2-A-like isoform X2 [Triplophysa dalaica]|uniref:targeting protein for Xklp2-A-like isoform X2 n=1 Tax=Triplophysa dalaica TaxID=1582913 RepID=UPI0024DFA347|nr:targeting protein for Xklp2-A-like isoform X2 [Triplophysa dalaica]
MRKSTSTEPPSNIVTSWGNGTTTSAPGQAHKAVPFQPRRVPKRPVPKNEKPTGPTTCPVIKKRRVVAAATARGVFEHRQRSSTSKSARRSSPGVRKSIRLRNKHTVSKTPDVISHTVSISNAAQQKSSEQYELQRIETLLKEVAEQRRKNEASYKAALAGYACGLIMEGGSVDEYTWDALSQIYNDNRPKAPMVEQGESTSSESTSTEPPSNIVTSWGNGTTTAAPGQARKAVPFQPRRVPKRPVPKNEKPTGPTTCPVIKKRVVAAATARGVFEHHRRSSTSKSARRSSPGVRKSIRLRNKHTVSKTPDVISHTASTSNAAQQKSSEQYELQRIETLLKEVAEQRRKNEASYKAALAGCQPPKQVMSTTIPKEFNFHSDNRLKNHTDRSSAEDSSYKEINFTSQLRKHPASPGPKGTTIPKPFNLSRGKQKLEETGIYVAMPQQIEQFQKRTPTRYHLRSRQCQERGPSPVKPDKPKITHPKTQQLMTLHRPTVEKPPAPIKALAVPHFQPFLPKPLVKSQVEMCPFSFEERDRERRAKKEKTLEELRHEKVPRFKAQPLPDFHEVHLPEKKVFKPTKPVPFRLMLDERAAAKGERMLKEELKCQAEAACFKARPNTIVHKEPFVPKKENRSILERRAKERLEFEREMWEKEALKAHMEKERAREEEEQEKEEITRLRHEQVHNAQPIRRYKPVEVKKSEMSLTVPHSPNFQIVSACKMHYVNLTVHSSF